MRDLNDLSFFAAVVANGGFSAASRALDVPKSRISRRVAALEAQLGVRLIERSTRRFNVTEVGHDVYRHARAALAEADAIDDVALRLTAEPQGLVRLSCPQGVDRLLAAELPAFLERHPKLRIQVLVGNRRVDLIEEGVDLAIRVRDELDGDGDLQLKIIGRTQRLLVASPEFLAARGRPQTPAEMEAYPTISLTERPGPDRWELVNADGAQTVVTHEPRLSATEFSILRQAALDGLGIGFMAEYACRDPLADGRLERVLPEWGGHEAIFHVVFTSRRGLLPSVRVVLDFIAAALDPRSQGWRNAL